MTSANCVEPQASRWQWMLRGRQLLAPTPVTSRHRRVWGWFCLTLAHAMLVAVLMWATITEGPYEFLASQPKTMMLASLSNEASNIPSFTGQSVLVSAEVAIPYHQGYYTELEQRTRALITAQFTTDPAVLRNFIQQYGVTHWLLDPFDYNPDYLASNRWIQQYQPEAERAVLALRYGKVPVLAALGDRCTQFNHDNYRVLNAQCILAATAGG